MKNLKKEIEKIVFNQFKPSNLVKINKGELNEIILYMETRDKLLNLFKSTIEGMEATKEEKEKPMFTHEIYIKNQLRKQIKAELKKLME